MSCQMYSGICFMYKSVVIPILNNAYRSDQGEATKVSSRE